MPTSTPTTIPTATPTLEPTADVTAEPTLEPTLEPTVEPTDTAEPVETPPATTGDALFFDGMDDPTSGWTTGSGEFAEIVYDVSSLEIELLQAPAYAYSERDLDEEYGVVLSAAEFSPSAEGGAALLCLGPSDASGDVGVGALFTTDGDLLFINVAGGDITTLERNDDIGFEMPVDQDTLFGIACAGTSTGALRIVAFGTRTGPLATYQSDEGPETFSGVGLYAETSEAGFTLDVATAATYGISGSAVGMSPEGEELLTHVPSDWQNQCIESPVVENEVAAIVCFLQQDGAGVELASYEVYATNDDMDTQYQERVTNFGVESTGTCQEGPNETTWSIEGEGTLGRVQCAPQLAGIRIDWTDDRLGILSSLIDFQQNYGLMYDTWLNAGPNP